MARPALSAARGIDIIDFLARFPGREFTLSEIAKGAGINLASCHAILSTLEERGYLARSAAQKTYRLGASLYATGQVALASQPILRNARRAAQDLTEELGIPSLVSTVVGEEIVGMVACDTMDGRTAGLNVGERMPLVPPVGASFLAWASDAEIEQWLDRARSDEDEATVKYWRDGLARIRERSFQVELKAPGGTEMADRMTEMAQGREAVRYKSELLKLVQSLGKHPEQPGNIIPAAEYDLILIAAPIFDQEGRCAYNLCLGGFAAPMTGERVYELGERLVETCLQLMRQDRA